MSSKNYFPLNDSEFLIWFQNYFTKLKTNYTTDLAVSDGEIDQLESEKNDATNILNELQAARAKVQSLTETKNSIFEKVQKHVRDMTVILKRRDKYTAAIGEDLGVIGPKPLSKSNIPAGTKPTFQAIVMSDKVRLDWVKGEFSGVAIYSKRGSETNFTFLSRDNRSPYDDTRHMIVADQPEAREYRMHYLLGDDEVGDWSDIVRVVCLI
jgi:hypothetical protein